jgi:hypothetical protein
MSNQPYVPVPTKIKDARNRALRTFWQGVGTDVAASAALAIVPTLSGADFAWTGAYWAAVGLLAAKTAILTAVSYIARLKAPPPPSLTR